jgi:hypothetical protein
MKVMRDIVQLSEAKTKLKNTNVIHLKALQFKLAMYLKYSLFVILSHKFLVHDVAQGYNFLSYTPNCRWWMYYF